ncbi:MAG: chromosomal replication initiator protein DnaA, partial [Bacteroidetes bacterium]
MQKDCNTVWNNCLEIIKEDVADQGFNTWFMPIVPLKLDGKSITIQVPSQFFYEWLEEHYIHVLKKALIAVIGEGAKLEYSVIVDQGNKKNAPYVINLPNRSVGKGGNYRNNERPQGSNPFHLDVLTEPQKSQLNQAYSFNSFIEGDCNRLARSAGYAVAKKPGLTSFNPLMIYGGVGLGKTHLVQSIGNEIKANLPEKFVLYVSSEKFINQFIKAVQNNEVQSFQAYYLQVDVLIIDDVQFFGNKEKTQEIFFHIFNHLHQSGKQIIMTSDRPPKDLKGLEERLLSRFKWGLTADL